MQLTEKSYLRRIWSELCHGWNSCRGICNFMRIQSKLFITVYSLSSAFKNWPLHLKIFFAYKDLVWFQSKWNSCWTVSFWSTENSFTSNEKEFPVSPNCRGTFTTSNKKVGQKNQETQKNKRIHLRKNKNIEEWRAIAKTGTFFFKCKFRWK